MTLHPDVLTDLVILYHAGEASQASRELLENEAKSNPALAAALAAPPRVMQPIDAIPMTREQEALKRVRQHYLYRALIAVGLALALVAVFSFFLARKPTLGSSHVTGDVPTKSMGSEPR